MTRTWTVCRQYSPRPDGERRWDQAYQLLARQAGQGALPGRALSNRTQVAPARGRKPAMLPAGPGVSHAPRPEPEYSMNGTAGTTRTCVRARLYQDGGCAPRYRIRARWFRCPHRPGRAATGKERRN